MFPYYFALVIAMGAVQRTESFEDSWLAPSGFIVQPGPLVVATKGEVWPHPLEKITREEVFVVRPSSFQFKVTGQTCGILERALQRYKHDLRIHERVRRTARTFYPNDTEGRSTAASDNVLGYLDELTVNLRSPCEERPHKDMDELYELRINTEDFPNKGVLVSDSIWGILRGLETWSQLIYFSLDYNGLMINSTSIMDLPRFSHRGLLIDTSRHFLPLRTIFAMLDAMSMSKLNVLHWHIVDDQSFPFQSVTFPDLSSKGAYAPTHVYTPSDVQSVISYATDRGIRVVPEFDTPGHTRSWGQGYPELLTECYSEGQPDGNLGPMNPIVPGTYEFMKELMREIKTTFPDSFVHLGGDEVEFECWESNPEIQEFMRSHGKSTKKLEEIYITKIIDMATNLSMKPIVWQEVFDNGANLSDSTIVHVWKGNHQKELYDVTRKGHKALLSSCWYLDGLNSGGDWQKFYNCDPHDFSGSSAQKKLVFGGEACMWGEVVDVNNVMSRVWPRAAAAAEKLWSRPNVQSVKDAAKRLEEHSCRMNRRKIPAQPPNGPGFCPGLNYT